MRYAALPTLMLAGAVAFGAAACERDARRTDEERARDAAEATRETGRDAGEAARDAARDAGDATRDAGRDASGAVGTAGRATAGAVETMDVKAALMADDAVDASGINVETNGDRKVVVLKGTVTSASQKNRAEQIAAREAEGYRIDNQLVVKAR